MLETLSGVDVPLALLLEGTYFWWEEDKLFQSVQEVQHKDNHIYTLTMDDGLFQTPIQGAQRVFESLHISICCIL